MIGAGAEDDVSDRARLLRIEDTRRDEPAFLESLLASPSSATRASAALTAGRIGGALHLASLHSLVGDANSRVAANAFFALAMMHDTTALPLVQRALHGNDVVGAEAVSLLGALGERGRQPLIAALGDSSLTGAVRASLLLAATRLRPVPVTAIAPWVSSTDSAITWRAAYAIARGRSASGVRTLMSLTDSPFGSVREQSARGLSHTVAGDSLGDAAFTALSHLVLDAEPHVRINAVRSLATYGRKASAPVRNALADVDANVRLTAAQSLDAVLDSSFVSWRDAMSVDTTFVVQRAVAEGAVKHLQGDAVPRTWRTSAEWQRRAAMAELDAIGPALAALPRTGAWLTDSDGRVRAAALGAVARLADSASTRVAARTTLRTNLNDADAQVRATALGGLSSSANVDDLILAVNAYPMSLRDNENDARLAFWQLADSALRSRPTLPDSLERRLATLARPSDPLERIAAAHITRFAAWADSSSTPRDMAWYEQRAGEALASRQPHAVVETERGTMELELFGSDAPLTVYNFVALARSGYFDGQRFHRVVPNFVAQAGDPRGDGNGGPGYAIRDEINPRRYLRGTLGMALSGPNTGGSQFFVTHSPQPHLDGGYTVFGQLIAGGGVLDRIVQGDRIVRITIR